MGRVAPDVLASSLPGRTAESRLEVGHFSMRIPQFRLGVLFGLTYAAAVLTMFAFFIAPRWSVVLRMWHFVLTGEVR